MKKIICILLTITMLASSSMTSYAAVVISSTKLTKRNTEISVSYRPYLAIPKLPKIPDITNSVKLPPIKIDLSNLKIPSINIDLIK